MQNFSSLKLDACSSKKSYQYRIDSTIDISYSIDSDVLSYGVSTGVYDWTLDRESDKLIIARDKVLVYSDNKYSSIEVLDLAWKTVELTAMDFIELWKATHR